jgi:hypothetical protein
MSVRTASSSHQCGSAADASCRSAEANSEATITGLRPNVSESALASSMRTESVAVVSESEKLLSAGLTWNSRVKIGSSGCTV